MFNEAFRLGYIMKNPVLAVKQLAEKPLEKGILTDKEVKKLFAFPWKDKIAELGNKVAMYTGMRQGEILALRAENIFPDHIEVKLRSIGYRIVPIGTAGSENIELKKGDEQK